MLIADLPSFNKGHFSLKHIQRLVKTAAFGATNNVRITEWIKSHIFVTLKSDFSVQKTNLYILTTLICTTDLSMAKFIATMTMNFVTPKGAAELELLIK